jgi:predicted membrane-bound spermidine synthase/Na+-translocating ferredoxin:NAD+ oxidoreductase RnfG subunit
MMKPVRSFFIFSYGLFTIAAQTLLFREFITTFEGNDIAVGIFFASWFLWVGLGAFAVYRNKTLADLLQRHIEFLLLAYIPAFVLQWMLLLHARQLVGIQSYQLFPTALMIALSVLVNAPLSCITGLFFPVASGWIQRDQALPVSKVYVLEAAGSFCGGLGVTILLAFGTTTATVFFIISLIVSLAALGARLTRSPRLLAVPAGVIFLGILYCLTAGLDTTLMQRVQTVKWAKLLPADTFAGSFQTAQAQYLYGNYQGQWLTVRQGSVAEAMPDAESAARVAATCLCQNPKAKKVLVIGSGLELCRQLLRLEQIDQVTWAHCDPEYPAKVEKFAPPKFRITDRRLHRLPGDVRAMTPQKQQSYDIAIINLPDPTSSVLNRYYTHQFYRQIAESLAPDGVLCVRISGGENIMGTELISLGASTRLTLNRVFSKFAITPGDQTWFLASNSDSLTADPGTLMDRFAAIKGAADIFPPQGLLSIYLPDRAAKALDAYASTDLPEKLLINRDDRPLASLYSLLLSAKQSGTPATKLIKYLAVSGIWPFILPLVVFTLLRIVYVSGTRRQGPPSAFNSTFLVFSAGCVGIGVVIVLMYLYQTRFGSLYLHVGLISSIFMIGLTFGGALTRYLLVNRKIRTAVLLPVMVIAHAVVLTVAAGWPVHEWTHLTFAVIFILAGLCTGVYFPLAAGRLADCNVQTIRAAGKLEMADHIGAAAGAFLTGLAIVPVVGTRATLLVFILLMLVNVLFAAFPLRPAKSAPVSLRPTLVTRTLGYILFGLGVCIILWSNLLARSAHLLAPPLPPQTVHALAAGLDFEQGRAAVEQAAGQIDYFKLSDSESKPAGYIFSTAQLAPDVRAFGGRFNLAVRTDTSGKLVNFHIVKSNETPAYLKLLTDWYDILKGVKIFEPDPFADVAAVTGATVSSEAFLSALQTSGQRFAAQVLGRPAEPATAQKTWAAYLPDTQALYLLTAFALALAVSFLGGFWTRLTVLLLTLITGGIILNAQYSTEQITSLLSARFPSFALSGVFLLAIGVPVLVVVFGNYYCGYICPFGAAQELAGFILPQRFRSPLPKDTMHWARFVKYVVLFIFIAVFFTFRNHAALTPDPLIEVFSGALPTLLLATAGIALIGSIFYIRFWCRYLCPVGAFLSLLSGIALLRRLTPAKKFGRCEFGVTGKTQLDCIYCDRCRYEFKSPASEKPAPVPKIFSPGRWPGFLSRHFLIPVLLLAIFISAVSISTAWQTLSTEMALSSASGSAGVVRDVDLKKIRTLIRQNRLSDHEADFYKKIE